MRWKTKDSTGPSKGDRRTRKGFLWLPKTIKGETRWLEFARWREWYWMPYPHGNEDGWFPECWLEFDTPHMASPDPPWKPPTTYVRKTGRVKTVTK